MNGLMLPLARRHHQRTKNILQFGPKPLRNRKSARATAEKLTALARLAVPSKNTTIQWIVNGELNADRVGHGSNGSIKKGPFYGHKSTCLAFELIESDRAARAHELSGHRAIELVVFPR